MRDGGTACEFTPFPNRMGIQITISPDFVLCPTDLAENLIWERGLLLGGRMDGEGCSLRVRTLRDPIAAGDLHGCVIQAETGHVACWGADGGEQASPPDIVNGTTGTATAIAAGHYHSCAIQAGTGRVICWGDDFNGQATPPPTVDGTTKLLEELLQKTARNGTIDANGAYGPYLVEFPENPFTSVNTVKATNQTSIAAGDVTAYEFRGWFTTAKQRDCPA